MEVGQHITHHAVFSRVVHVIEACLLVLIVVVVLASSNVNQVSALGLGQRRVTVIDPSPGITSPHEFLF